MKIPSLLWLMPAMLLLAVLILVSFVVVGVAVWPIARPFVVNTTTPTSMVPATNTTDREELLKEKLETYSKRADDLQKLISILLGLSTIYAIVLAVGAYTSVQSNLQQAEKSIAKLESLLQDLPKGFAEIQEKSAYSTKITIAHGSLALALQAKYLEEAEFAIRALLDLRKGAYSTDRYVNMLLGRLFKALNRFQNAEEAMTSFIGRKEASGEGDDAVTGDAYYNRACYQSLRWTGAKPEEQKKLSLGIQRDLDRIFRLSENYRADVRVDDDFRAVKQEQWFKDLVG
jgi:hypothetical protein